MDTMSEARCSDTTVIWGKAKDEERDAFAADGMENIGEEI